MASGSSSERKRENYIDWEDYFMDVAKLAAQRSKDPNTQVGACLVTEDKKIISIGYNGMPIGCSDDKFPWGRESKHLYVCHAEMNAIVLNENPAKVKNSTIYVTLFPCNECAKVIIQAGIREVVYLSDEKGHKEKFVAAKKMFDADGVKIKTRQFIPKSEKIERKNRFDDNCETNSEGSKIKRIRIT